ncbi:MAG: hypothetical protein M0042_04170 [Nitrospiraceae bacterium]|nr:hypothetical protein [Nitrospiraceae bacterium]
MNRRIILMAALFIVAAGLAGSVFAAEKKTANPFVTGELTSVESDGTVVIDNNGYLVSPFALILDGKKRKVPLSAIPIPSPVYIEFTYSTAGPVINLLRVNPQ